MRGIKLFGNRGETPDIGKYSGHLPFFAAKVQLVGVFDNFGNNFRRKIAGKRTLNKIFFYYKHRVN